MAFNRKDHYHKKAKQDGYRSRAVYKLQELQKRFKLFRRGNRVLDLGAAPGGWLQAAHEFVGKRGRLVGVDLLPIDPLPIEQVTILEGDIMDEEIREQAITSLGGPAHVVLSDMAPNITGIRTTDCARSYDLSCCALDTAVACLRTEGHFIVKIFPGDDFENFLKLCKEHFRKVRTTKPDATRKSSSEVYVICLQFRGRPDPQETEEPATDTTPTNTYDPLADGEHKDPL